EFGLIPDELQRPLVKDPEGPALSAAYRYIYDLDPASPKVREFARQIAAHRVALLPTLSGFYTRLPDHRNLWKEPVATILDPKRMFMPSDPTTGDSTFPSDADRVSNETNARRLWALNESIVKERPRYLAASAASVFGAMPGISMHIELELL